MRLPPPGGGQGRYLKSMNNSTLFCEQSVNSATSLGMLKCSQIIFVLFIDILAFVWYNIYVLKRETRKETRI